MTRLLRPEKLSEARASRLGNYELSRGRPLPLFEALAHSETAFEDLAAGTKASIEGTILTVRLREILILRTLAQWGARAEWDVHAQIYAPVAPLRLAEVEWLGGSVREVLWSTEERLLIDCADQLRARANVPNNLWAALAHAFDARLLAEILMVATQYVKVALMTNALGIPTLVPNGPAMIAKGTRNG